MAVVSFTCKLSNDEQLILGYNDGKTMIENYIDNNVSINKTVGAVMHCQTSKKTILLK